MEVNRRQSGPFSTFITETSNIRGTEHSRAWDRSSVRGLFADQVEKKGVEAVVEIHPQRLTAGQRERVEITFHHIHEYLEEQGHLLVYLPQFWGGIRQERDPSVFIVDKAPGTYNGYISANISAEGSNKEWELAYTVTTTGTVHTVVDIVLLKGKPQPGDSITVKLGDDLGQLPRSYEFSGIYRFAVAVDRYGIGEYIKICSFPEIEITAGKPAKFMVHVPSFYDKDNFTVRITAVDEYLNKVSEYQGELEIFLVDEAKKAVFIGKETMKNGMVDIKSISLLEEGTFRISALCKSDGLGGLSNPFENTEEKGGGRIYFGEIHCHSELSDAVGAPKEAYRFAKENLGLDFASLSDHMDINGLRSLYYNQEERWRKNVETANSFNKESIFPTLIGQEWTGKPHINVYYRGSGGTHLSSQDPRYDNPDKLWEYIQNRMDDNQVLTVIHHPKYLGRDVKWRYYHEKLMRCVEIYSGWGSSESGDESAVLAGLCRGYVFGFTGGTDNHIGKIGQGNMVNEGGGITAVIVDDLSRESVFDALYQRHCYATTGAKVLLNFGIDGYIMGDILSKRDSEPRRFHIKVIGTDVIKMLFIIKNGEEISLPIEHGSIFKCTWEDTADGKRDWYYIKVVQEDGHMAWSSPIWINRV